MQKEGNKQMAVCIANGENSEWILKVHRVDRNFRSNIRICREYWIEKCFLDWNASSKKEIF
jgi:hypothetical protein